MGNWEFLKLYVCEFNGSSTNQREGNRALPGAVATNAQSAIKCENYIVHGVLQALRRELYMYCFVWLVQGRVADGEDSKSEEFYRTLNFNFCNIILLSPRRTSCIIIHTKHWTYLRILRMVLQYRNHILTSEVFVSSYQSLVHNIVKGSMNVNRVANHNCLKVMKWKLLAASARWSSQLSCSRMA